MRFETSWFSKCYLQCRTVCEEIYKGSIILQKVFFLKLFREYRLCTENICNEQKENFNVRSGKKESTSGQDQDKFLFKELVNSGYALQRTKLLRMPLKSTSSSCPIASQAVCLSCWTTGSCEVCWLWSIHFSFNFQILSLALSKWYQRLESLNKTVWNQMVDLI